MANNENNRVRELRKELGLTLEKFGVRLGVGKTAISGIETGRRGLTDQIFLSICREYNVNPGWLRFGNGPMFLDKHDSDDYMAAAASLSDDPLVTSCLIEYAKLQPSDREIIRNYIDNIILRYNEQK